MKTFYYFILLLLPQLCFAVTTWQGAATITLATWNTAANWTSGVPTASEQVIFNTSVTISQNVPLTSGNTIKVQNSLTIANGVTLVASDVLIDGGTFINNGTFTGNNMTYSNLGGIVINNNILSLKNLNTGNASIAGSFTNNDTLAVLMDIVVEEGVFDNNGGGTVTSAGLDVQNGGTVLNGGSFRSSGNSSSVQVNITDGGFFTNEASGTLTIDFGTSNVYSIKVQGGFNNLGTVNVGHSPFNPGSQGILVGSNGDFSNSGLFVFMIDSVNCVVVDNHGINGSYINTGHFTIVSGKNCLNSLLPIRLSSLTGKSEEGFNTISWTIEDVSTLKSSILQRSEHGSAKDLWNTISNYINENASTSSYLYKDYSMYPISFYRLKSIDQDGTIYYSSIISINNRSINKSLQLYPVPARRFIHLDGLLPTDISHLTVYNTSGLLVKEMNLYSPYTSQSKTDVDIQALPNGVYYLILSDQAKSIKEKFKFVKID